MAARAQDVLSQPTEFYEQMTALPGTAVAAGPAILTLGPVDFHPHLTYGFTDASGVLSQPGRPGATIINTVSPGLSLNLATGWHWTLDYTPSLTYYSNPQFRDTLSQTVRLSGGTTYRDWSFRLSQSYSDSSSLTTETGTQTETTSYATSLGAACQLGSKTSLSLSAIQALNSTPGYISYDTWSGSLGLNYQFWPGLSAGVSAGGGYDAVSSGSPLAFETLSAHISWLVREKLSLLLSGGLEDSQFLGLQGQSVLSPIYSASIQYHPFDATSLGLVGARTVSPSLFQDQLIESTTVSATVNQRLLKMFQLSLSAGYSLVPYHGEPVPVYTYKREYALEPPGTPPLAVATIPAPRQDTTVYWRVGLSCPFLRRGTASIFYYSGDNSSSASAFSYSTSQIGLNLSYRF